MIHFMAKEKVRRVTSALRRGDTVMVIAGGNKKKRVLKGQTGKIVRFTGSKMDRVIVEGLNMITRHQRAAGPDKPAGKVEKEGSIHISNLMYYLEKAKKPVRLQHSFLADGKKVRGYKDPGSGDFVQIAD